MMSKKQLSVIKKKELSADTVKDFLHADAEPDEVPPADYELPEKSLFDHIVDAKFQGDISKAVNFKFLEVVYMTHRANNIFFVSV